MNMNYLGWFGYSGMDLDVDAVKVILEKFLKDFKYFKVCIINWKGDMPRNRRNRKVVYYKYKG
jgi:hypothetical protein